MKKKYLILFKNHTYIEAENKENVIKLCNEENFDEYKIIQVD